MLKYCPNRYKTLEISDKAVDDFLPALKFVSNWIVTSKVIKKLDNASFANDDIIFIIEDFNNVTVFVYEIDIFSVNFNNINLDDVNFAEDDSETNIYVKLIAWSDRFQQQKSFKKLIPVAWNWTIW